MKRKFKRSSSQNLGKFRKTPQIKEKWYSIADLHTQGVSNIEIAKRFNMSPHQIGRVLEKDIIQNYLKEQREKGQEFVNNMYYLILDKVQRQIGLGVEKRVTWKVGNKTITKISRPWVKEAMELAKLAGKYNPSLKVIEDKKEDDNSEINKQIRRDLEEMEKNEETRKNSRWLSLCATKK